MASNNDPFDFSRLFGNMGGFSLPGIVTPTLDIDELDKKIKDLKAVEGWLSMNLSMLQMSIQGLEVQRNTLSSIKAMGEAFNKGMEEAQKKPPAEEPKAAPESTPAASATAETILEEGSESKPVWPWELAAQAMQGLHEQLQQASSQRATATETAAKAKASSKPSTKTTAKKPSSKPTATKSTTSKTSAQAKKGTPAKKSSVNE